MAYPERASYLFFFFNCFPPLKESKLGAFVFFLPTFSSIQIQSPFLLHSSLSQRLSTTTTTIGDVGSSHGRGQPGVQCPDA